MLTPVVTSPDSTTLESSRDSFLPFALPYLGDEEINEVIDTLRSGWLSVGPKTKEFEARFADAIGTAHALAVNSATSALHLALLAAGIGEGDEVITSPVTFCATANVVIHQRARPVFADVSRADCNLDPARVEEKITPRTRAILPVHLAGHPCQMDELMDIARRHNLLVIEDAAHAVGAAYKGRKIGTIGDMTAFSFYAIKNLTTGEGGMLTTENTQWADTARNLSLHGISRDAWTRYTAKGSWYYEVIAPGYKYNMTDIQAALGLHQLRRLPEFTRIRTHYAAMYSRAFADLPEIRVPTAAPDVTHNWHLYIIHLVTEMLTIDRAQFIEALKAHNIGASVHFIPLHLQPYYQSAFGYGPGDFPVAEELYAGAVSLPLYPAMTEADVLSVVEAVRHIVRTHRR
jgi:dTDP-4-amino-4,6-dideoxygalactose transaminase